MKSIDNGTNGAFTYNAYGWRVYNSSGSVSYLYDPSGQFFGGVWPGGGNNSFMFMGSRLMAGYVADGAHFAHANVLGSETHMTDWAGNDAQAILYYPWGQVWSNPGGNSLLQVYASLTLYDTVNNGYVPPFRYYVSNQGRWLTPDPLAGDVMNPQSLNRYAYVLNNPTTLTDPLGLSGYVSGPPCNGPGQISCSQYFAIIGPSAICPAEFGSCYATAGGAIIGVNGTSATAFTFGTPVNTVGQPCNAQVIAAGECAGGLAGISDPIATGTFLESFFIRPPGPIQPRIGPVGEDTIGPAPPSEKPSCADVAFNSFFGGLPDAAKDYFRDKALTKGSALLQVPQVRSSIRAVAQRDLGLSVGSSVFRGAGEALLTLADVLTVYSAGKAAVDTIKANVHGRCRALFSPF